MTYTQENRPLAVETPLGRDVLLLRGFRGEEGISRLFRFDLDLLSEDANVDYDKIVGKPVGIRVKLDEDEERFFHGCISRFCQKGRGNRFTEYEAEMVPWTWFLTLTSDCRIFQRMEVPDIIEKIFDDLGFSDYRIDLQASYPEREFCVQYRETDFNFVSRLMEQYGIFYYFEHESDKHTMVLADKRSELEACPHQETVRYLTTGSPHGEAVVDGWRLEQYATPLKYALEDYNFETPKLELKVSEESVLGALGPQKYEIYDYPGEYANKDQGETLIRTRLEEEEASRKVASGTSCCRAFSSGYTFRLEDHYRADLNTEYLLTSVHHECGDQYYDSGPGTPAEYQNSFEVIPAAVPFRPRRTTFKPVVEGPQTAVVVGPAGEEIYTDKHGRVKVQFHWDREGTQDENSSCWIRVAQVWAGKSWGGIHIPRIGQEVIVEFLEGDPDQPIVTGRVYNADQTVPYDLPSNMTQSGIKSRSSKGGGPANFNEIRFEDKKGQEQVYIHAEKNLSTVVEANESRSVGNDRSTTIGHDDSLTVKNKYSRTVKEGDEVIIVELGNRSTAVSAGNSDNEVRGNYSLKVDGNHLIKVGGMSSVKVVGAAILKTGAARSVKAAGPYLVNAPTVKITAGALLTLKCGASKIVMSPGVISIKAPLVKINT